MSLPPEFQIIQDQKEFNNAIRDITRKSLLLETVHDRLRCSEWICKLTEIPDTESESAKLKNDYVQYLRLMVESGLFHGPFSHMPPQTDLLPFPQYLGNQLCKSIPELPKIGSVPPVINHRSPDGRAHLAAQKIPGGGIFCYLAVSPDGF